MNGAAELLRCRPWIEDALEYSGGTHAFEDVVQGIVEGRMQLWPAARGCAVTEIVLYPRKSVLHVFLAGGEMDQIIDMIDSAVEWSKGQGCTSMTIAGRHGWARVLGKYGYRPVMTVLEKEFAA
ncbi:MAG: hypothetical protein RLZ51_1896 [Pseudomonadota bacterium]|jgi:hypothetical protein